MNIHHWIVYVQENWKFWTLVSFGVWGIMAKAQKKKDEKDEW